MSEYLFWDNAGINVELCFKFQAFINPFDQFSKELILPSNTVTRTFSALSVNVAIFVSTPFASCQSGDWTENSKI